MRGPTYHPLAEVMLESLLPALGRPQACVSNSYNAYAAMNGRSSTIANSPNRSVCLKSPFGLDFRLWKRIIAAASPLLRPRFSFAKAMQFAPRRRS
jgi:hypothetical protein